MAMLTQVAITSHNKQAAYSSIAMAMAIDPPDSRLYEIGLHLEAQGKHHSTPQLAAKYWLYSQRKTNQGSG